MELKIIKKSEDRVEFNVKGIDVSMANALRKIIISEIPIMAIEDVTFYDNSSVMHDEILAHRLGLIPLKTDPTGPDKIKISLDVRGPGIVYAKDLKVAEKKIKGKKLRYESIAVYDRIPIIKLTENQKIKLEATAILGKGKEHIKWQGGLASYEIKDDGSFDFFVESYGQMSVDDLIKSAFNIFNKKLDGLKSSIKNLK
ncbi:MAG: DNA-directed RNA polymerase subunit D [Candidatus Altiarchaeales archaeon]|nr:MAG: DNA-directed RNA polymerase subunit D [Candidatus Altiarchaeales archaeon]